MSKNAPAGPNWHIPALVHEMVNQRTMASEAVMPQPDGRVESVEWPLTMSIFS
jgi:hypothetical protein